MNEQKFDFWQDHSAKYLEMALSRENDEIISAPDGYAKKTGVCGDTIEFFIVIHNDVINHITHHINGCQNTYACANAIVHLVQGRRINHAWEITPEKVAAFLETLPADHFHCAELAVGALYLALASVQETRRAPWKKHYR
jgi:nitrogen fixation NifU-like protein